MVSGIFALYIGGTALFYESGTLGCTKIIPIQSKICARARFAPAPAATFPGSSFFALVALEPLRPTGLSRTRPYSS